MLKLQQLQDLAFLGGLLLKLGQMWYEVKIFEVENLALTEAGFKALFDFIEGQVSPLVLLWAILNFCDILNWLFCNWFPSISFMLECHINSFLIDPYASNFPNPNKSKTWVV